MRITDSQRLLVALLNIDTDNNIMNNTKEYKLIKRKDKTIYPDVPLSLSLRYKVKLFNSMSSLDIEDESHVSLIHIIS
jgi:hypothetical protein